MKEKIIKLLSVFFKKLNDFPEAVIVEVNKTILLGFLFLLGSFIYAVFNFKFLLIPFSIGITAIYFLLFWLVWFRHFQNDTVICYEGKVLETENGSDSKLKKLINKVTDRYVRKSYKLLINNSIIVKVVKSNKKIKPGMFIRIYTLPNNIFMKSDKSYFINSVLLTEILESEG